MPQIATKLIQIIVGFSFGSFAAILGTITHQTRFGHEVPIGLLFSLSLVLMLAAGIRDRQREKLSSIVFAITLAVELFLIAQNLTGDILIPANNSGLWWSYGAIGVASLVALWPKIKI